MKAKVSVMLKSGVLDSQGKTIKHALESLGFKGLGDVRIGKSIEIELTRGTPAAAKQDVERMCQKLLANPVVETYKVDISKA